MYCKQLDGLVGAVANHNPENPVIPLTEACNCGRTRGVVEAYREQLEGVVERLRTRLPPAKAAALRHFDSFGLLEVYNSHHASAHAARQASDNGLAHAFVGATALSQPT